MSKVPSGCDSTSVICTRQPTRYSDCDAVVADLVALADPDRAEQPLGRVLDPQQVVHQRAVAVLEDVQRHADAREHHRVQREHRQRVAHVLNLVRHRTAVAGAASTRATRSPDGAAAARS